MARISAAGDSGCAAPLLVDAQERAQQIFGALLASSRKRDLRRAGAKAAEGVIGDVKSYGLGRAGGGRRKPAMYRRRETPVVPRAGACGGDRIHGHNEHQQRGHGDQKMAGNHADTVVRPVARSDNPMIRWPDLLTNAARIIVVRIMVASPVDRGW